MTARTFTFNVVNQSTALDWTPPAPNDVVSFPNSVLGSDTLGVKNPPLTLITRTGTPTVQAGAIRGLYTETTVAYAPELGPVGSIIAHGGGHNNYAGNEIYAWDIKSAAWTRIKDAYNPLYERSYPDYTVLGAVSSGAQTIITVSSHTLVSPTMYFSGFTGDWAAFNGTYSGIVARGGGNGTTFFTTMTFNKDSSTFAPYSSNGGKVGVASGSQTDTTYGEFLGAYETTVPVAPGMNGPGYQPGSTHTYDTLKCLPAGVLTTGPALIRVTAGSGYNNALQYRWVHYIDLANPNTNGWQRLAPFTWVLNYGSVLHDPVLNRLVAFKGRTSGNTISTLDLPTPGTAVERTLQNSTGTGAMTATQFGELHTEYWVCNLTGKRYYILVTGIEANHAGSSNRQFILVDADTLRVKTMTMDWSQTSITALGPITTGLSFRPSARCFYFVRNAWSATETVNDADDVLLQNSMYQTLYKCQIPDDPWNGTWVWTETALNQRPLGWVTEGNPFGDAKGRLRWVEQANCLLWFPWPNLAVQAIGVP